MSILGLYPKYIVPKIIYFQWPVITKIQCIYQNKLKEVNGDHKYLRFPGICGNNFDILRSSITLNKVYLVCVETVKAKPTEIDSGFITYLSTIYFLVYL